MWETLLQADGLLLLWIQEYIRNDVLDLPVKLLTHLGDRGLIWLAAAVLFLLIPGVRKTGYLMLVSLSGSLLVNNLLLKNLVARVRPYEAVAGLYRIIEEQADFSFPSGHTGSSFAAAVIIYHTCPRRVGIPAMVLAVLMGFTRLYAGVHYPTDVLAGAVTGTAVALTVLKIYPRLPHRPAAGNTDRKDCGLRADMV